MYIYYLKLRKPYIYMHDSCLSHFACYIAIVHLCGSHAYLLSDIISTCSRREFSTLPPNNYILNDYTI